MYIFTNALKNVARNKGRNLLLGAITLAIIVTVIIAFCIHTASGSIIADYKTRFGAKVFINPDTSKLTVLSGRQSEQTVPLPVVYAALAGSDCLMGADLSCHVPSVSDTLLGLGEQAGGAVPIASGGGSFTKFPTMNVKGYTNPEQLDDFREGFRGITSGAFPTEKNECIISEDFALLNNLQAGDIMDIAQGMVVNNPLSLKVVGIYFDLTKNQFGAAADAPAAINVRNDIITTYETAFAFAKSDPRVDTAAYYLKSPELITIFESEARAAGLSDDYKVTIDEQAYNRIVAPVEGMAKISFTFMLVVLILGGLILILLASLAIRERKYEIGVLRAMGMKKRKVALGLICESLIITALCLAVGFAVGATAAQPVSDRLLRGQITAAEPNTGTGMGMMYAGVQTNVNAEPISALDVSFNLNVVLTMIGISLLLVTLSSAAGIIKITKYEPIKILMERN